MSVAEYDGLTFILQTGEEDSPTDWIEPFTVALVHAADLATSYLNEVDGLDWQWRLALEHSATPPCRDADERVS